MVRAVAQRVVDGRGFELVDVEVKRGRGESIVRLFVDKEGGIGLAELQSVSEEVSAILDAEDPIESNYTLEVSSPGLDRPLRHEADYRRFAGRLAKIVSTEPLNGQSAFSGRITGVDAGDVLLEEGRKTHRVPVARIKRGQLVVEF